MNAEPVIRISALEHYAYCPRQCALIHVDAAWSDSAHTVRGAYGHRRADTSFQRVERGRTVIRGVPLWSERLGLSGRADAIEIDPSGAVAPVEYKMGYRHGDAADIQVCAQALCIEEMLEVGVPSGFVWYAGTRRRQRIELDASLRDRTIEAISRVKELFSEPTLPVAPNDARCGECQLLGHCLPGVVSRDSQVMTYVQDEVFACGS